MLKLFQFDLQNTFLMQQGVKCEPFQSSPPLKQYVELFHVSCTYIEFINLFIYLYYCMSAFYFELVQMVLS